MIKLDDKMPFGKHKGTIVRNLAQTNYNYILWCRREIGTIFSDGVIYIAEHESRASWHRQLCWANGQSSKRKWRDWSKMTDERPNAKVDPDRISAPCFDDDNEETEGDFYTPQFDEYAGMDYSDFGNN